MSELTINISRLSEGTHQYSFETQPEDIGLDAGFHSPVGVQVVLEKTGRQMHLKADIRTKATFTCDRCLDECEQDLSAHYAIVYLTEENGAHGRNEDEVQYVSPDAPVLDLGDDVRQFLILAVPRKILCREDCQGLCPRCGVNRNKVQCKCPKEESDPRWEVLKKMSLN
ncbi:MAG TPA: DUF177 domain-containing protein [Bacteroidota bacterium]